MKNNIAVALLSLCFVCVGCHSGINITYNADLKKQYEAIAGGFPRAFHRENMLIADTLTSRQDTLNMDERRKNDTNVHIVAPKMMPGQNDTAVSHNPMEKYDVWFSDVKMVNDTLIIAFGYPFARRSVEQRILNNEVSTTYREFDKYRAFVTLDPQTPLKRWVVVPAKTVLFELSSKTYLTDTVFYGKATFETDPYYVKDNDFKSGFAKKSIRMSYIFKVKHIHRRQTGQ